MLMSTEENLCKILEKIGVDCSVHTDVDGVEWVAIIDIASLGRVDVLKMPDDEIYKVILHNFMPKNAVTELIRRNRGDKVTDEILCTMLQQGLVPFPEPGRMIIDGEEVAVVYSAYKMLYLKEKSVERLIDEIFHMKSLNMHIRYIVSSNLEGGNNEDRGTGNMYV